MDGGKRSLFDSRCIGNDDKTIIDQIMLKFRPIAPRPAGGNGSVSVTPFPAKDELVKKKRVKRKYVRVKRKNKSLRSAMQFTIGNEFPVTDPVQKLPNRIDFSLTGNKTTAEHLPSKVSDPRGGERVVVTWITMECVTGKCEDDGRLLRYTTDEEKMKSLENDACPWFLSDGCNGVQWVNLAYRRMLDPEGGAQAEVVVRLAVKEEELVAVKNWPVFSCRVRVVFGRKDEKMQMMTIPCDVWKMDFGGFAWRLDVEAALSLGPLN